LVHKTRTVALPSDSTFAIAMKTQQAAEREEQQRIKNLVLNYDLRDGEEQDGISPWAPVPPPNIHKNAGLEKTATLNNTRLDKSGNNRSGQRARKLQLSDVDWYAPKPTFPQVQPKDSSLGMVQTALPSSLTSPSPLSPRRSNAPFTHRLGRDSHTLRSGSRSGGRLTRKMILREHAARNAALSTAGKK
jgi:regulator of nonsense transcripts 2